MGGRAIAAVPERVTAAASVRLVARHVSALLIEREMRWQALMGLDRLTHLVSGVVSGSSLMHLPYRRVEDGRWIGIEAAADLGRPVNALSVAQSMGLPHTTVRRRAAALVAAGQLTRTPAGFTVAPGVSATPGLAEVMASDSRALKRTLSELATAGFAPAARAAHADLDAVPAGVVERLLLSFILRVLETFTETYGDFTSGTIEAAIVAANVHHLTADPELARLYAGEDQAPPDEIRRPIAVRALAKSLGMPFETVRRRVTDLVTAGLVVWRDGGVIVPTKVLQAERHIRNNRLILAHMETMINGLVALATPPRF